jgi:hypothetical protein
MFAAAGKWGQLGHGDTSKRTVGRTVKQLKQSDVLQVNTQLKNRHSQNQQVISFGPAICFLSWHCYVQLSQGQAFAVSLLLGCTVFAGGTCCEQACIGSKGATQHSIFKCGIDQLK